MTKKNRQPELIPRAEAPAAPVPQLDPPKPEAAEPQAAEIEIRHPVTTDPFNPPFPDTPPPIYNPKAQPPAVAGETVGPISESNALLRMAIDKDLDIEKLKILIDLRDREEERRAQSLFEFHFAEMQKDYVPAYFNKESKTKEGKIAFRYADLSAVLQVYAPILSKHGFSYRWDETEVPGAKEKTITCYLYGWGFTKQASITLPYGSTNLLINEIQARGSSSSYGRRYTFLSVTGCITADEDDSGEAPANPVMMKKNISLTILFLPKNFRQWFRDRLAAAKDEDLADLMREADGIKERCQKIIGEAEKRGGPKAKSEAIKGLDDVNDLDDLVEWESFCEGL